MHEKIKGFLADESGAMAVMIGLLMVLFLSFAALAVDYGYMAMVKGDLQKAADAGALAGAGVLGSPTNPDWTAGQAAATAIIEQNRAEGQFLTGQVDYGYWSKTGHTLQSAAIKPQDTDVPAIQVTIRKAGGENGGPVKLMFAPIFGINTYNLGAQAVAISKASTGGWSILEIDDGTLALNNNAHVDGDVGVNGNGPFTVKNNATVEGKAYLRTNTAKSIGNNAKIEGGIQQDTESNTLLQQATQAAQTEYDRIAGLVPSPEFKPNPVPKLTKSVTYTGSAKENVLDVTTFSLTNNAVLTLNAPASGSFTIRVFGTFALRNNAKIKLQGGITNDRVTFANMGGNTMQIDNNAVLNGSILSPKGAINISNNAAVNGVLVSGKDITLANNSMTTPELKWLPAPSGSGKGASLVH